ncbi:hypothetical protein CW304_31235 [Bacillus sp. UFRGS-B20]|nr:hypothetical protein CW304_31235 [Bacillus sp. UFRGS-B20]
MPHLTSNIPIFFPVFFYFDHALLILFKLEIIMNLTYPFFSSPFHSNMMKKLFAAVYFYYMRNKNLFPVIWNKDLLIFI